MKKEPIQIATADPLSRRLVDLYIGDTQLKIAGLKNIITVNGHSEEKRAQIEMVIGLFSDHVVKLTEIRNQLPE